MAKKHAVLAQAYLADLESNGSEVHKEMIASEIGVGLSETLVVRGAENLNLGPNDIEAKVDAWQQEHDHSLTTADVKKVVEEVLHYAKE
jgi:hypothetical protein